jgi:hypothetical protein
VTAILLRPGSCGFACTSTCPSTGPVPRGPVTRSR